MLKKISAFADQERMFQQSDKVIVGISGGADSICLLYVLLELKDVYNLQLRAVHINHGIRGKEALKDEAFVEELCKTWEVPLKIYRENVILKASEEKLSPEEAGRIVRREKLEAEANMWGGAKIALAHHQNDQIETMFLNIIRGTSLKGLGGMYPVNGFYVRPLLCMRRIEIEKYLGEREISFCTDSTNAEDIYTRNQIRNHIIQYIEEHINKNFISGAAEMMEQLRDIEAYMERQTSKAYERCIIENKYNKEILIQKKQFSEEESIISQRVAYRALCHMAGQRKDIESVHVNDIVKLLERQVGKEIHLPYKMAAVRNYEGISIRKKQKAITEKSECIKEQFHMRTLKKSDVNNTFAETPYTKRFDYDIIKNTVEIRNRRPGDFITIDVQGHTQKIKNFFINEKVPKEERNKILLAVDGSHVMWIIGFRQNPLYMVGKETERVLEIELCGGYIYERNHQNNDFEG